jgi:hypothetical protein
MWWHRQYHHWWVGPCKNIGLNNGYAFAEEDVDCPNSAHVWRRGGSGEIIPDVKVDLSFQSASVAASITHESSATAAVNYIIRSGHYKQFCRLVYRRGKFRCSKKVLGANANFQSQS